MMLDKEEVYEWMRRTHGYIGGEMHALRTERNLSIDKVSQLSGVKIADIDRLERGEIPIDWKVLARVAGCYDLRPTMDVQPADL